MGLPRLVNQKQAAPFDFWHKETSSLIISWKMLLIKTFISISSMAAMNMFIVWYHLVPDRILTISWCYWRENHPIGLIKKNFKKKFERQDEYFAVSVSESAVNRVRDYIKNQEEHHRKRSFQEGYHEFMRKYGFEKFVSG